MEELGRTCLKVITTRLTGQKRIVIEKRLDADEDAVVPGSKPMREGVGAATSGLDRLRHHATRGFLGTPPCRRLPACLSAPLPVCTPSSSSSADPLQWLETYVWVMRLLSSQLMATCLPPAPAILPSSDCA